jgi:hypothetical protein
MCLLPASTIRSHCLKSPIVLHILPKGGKKDAKYIAKIIMPLIQQVESEEDMHKKTSPGIVDLVFFDGASNIQNAGKILWAFNPHIALLDMAPSMLLFVLCRCLHKG